MILRRLELPAFGTFRDEVVEFAPGMNLVSGPNETGKTTLARAVIAVLYGVGRENPFVPWDEPRHCRAALVAETENRQVRIERDFVSGCVTWGEAQADGSFETLFCGYPEARDAIGDRKVYRNRLGELMGGCGPEVFQAHIYGDSDQTVRGAGAEVPANCFENHDTAQMRDLLRTLQSEYSELAGTNPREDEADGGGRLEQVAARLEVLEQEWFALQESIRRSSDGQEDPPLADSSTEDAVEPPEETAAVSEKAKAATPPVQADAAQRRRQLEEELDKTGLPHPVPEPLPALLAESAELRQGMAERKRALETLRAEQRRCRLPRWTLPLAVLLPVWAAVTAWWLLRDTLAPLWGGLVVTVAVAGWHAGRCLRVRAARRELDSQVTEAEGSVTALARQLDALADRFEALGLPSSPVEMARMQKNLARHRDLTAQLRELEGVVDVPMPAATATQDRAEREAPVPPTQAEAVPHGSPLTPLEKMLEARARIEAEGEELRAREARLKQRLHVLHLACGLLDDTLDAAAGCEVEAFTPLFADVLGELTGGAIEQARITPDYAVELAESEDLWLPAKRFGSATRALVRMALCLAFGAMYAERARLPLLLDDPFLRLDRKRRAQVLKVLETCAVQRQVILFSHDEGLRRRAVRDDWHLVSLRGQGPAVATSSEEKNKDDGQLSFL